MRGTRVIRLGVTFMLVLAGCTTRFGTGGDSDAGDALPEQEVEAGDVPAEPDAPDVPPTACTTDEECQNSVFCDGEERCGPEGTCLPGEPVGCDDSDPCSEDFCDVTVDECRNPPLDADGDGHSAARAPGGEECGGDDCDDGNPDMHPDAAEICNGLDEDCDLQVDEGALEDLHAADVLVDDTPQDHIQIGACWQGSEYGVAWKQMVLEGGALVGKLYFLRVDASGTPVGSPENVAAESDVRQVWDPDIACAPGAYGLVAAVEPVTGTGRIVYLYLVSTTGGSTSRTQVSEAAGHDLVFTDIAYDPLQRNWGVVWSDHTSNQVLYQRMTASGTRVGGNLVLDSGGEDAFRPRIAANGNGLFGMFWSDWRTVETHLAFVEIDATGARTTDPLPVETSTGALYPGDLASAGAGLPYGLTWAGGAFGGEEVYFATVEVAAGTASLASGPTAVSPLDTVGSKNPVVEFWNARSAFLVAWTDFTGGPTGSSVGSVRALRIDPGGAPLEPYFEVSVTGGMPWAPEVAENEAGGPPAVFWDDMRNHPSEYFYDLFVDFVGCP